MVELTDMDIDDALRRGQVARGAEPRALSARYEPAADRVLVELTNGCSFAFPPTLVQGLQRVPKARLTEIEISPTGYGLHWPALDVDVSVPGVLAGLFGTGAYMARRAGAATSPAKALAARSNGAKGGRPRTVPGEEEGAPSVRVGHRPRPKG